ncbi:MAG: transglycosylase SLT domain-containing protein, partial [Pseudomonadota bacterium]
PVIVDFPLPSKVVLCGEAFPLQVRDVYERLDMEFTIAVHSRSQVFLWMRRAGRYFPHIEKRLKAAGLPDDLKYLAVAESDLRSHVTSPAQARGTWQFIASTGQRHGLVKNKNFDERLNFELSTEAAISYLVQLKAMFGTWTLAMAAYNCGEGCVAQAIKEQEINDYFRLDLPYETERYVYRIAAIKMILENPQRYGYTFPPERTYKPMPQEMVSVNLSGEVHLTRVAKAIGTDYKVLKELNPQILGTHLPEGTYSLAVPAGLGAKTTAFLNELKKPAAGVAGGPPAPKTEAKYYVVKPGDTLTQISMRTGVPVEALCRLNNIQGSNIWSGQRLKLAD